MASKRETTQVGEWLNSLEDYQDKFSQWEATFFTRMYEKYTSEESFSPMQLEKLEELYNKFCRS